MWNLETSIHIHARYTYTRNGPYQTQRSSVSALIFHRGLIILSSLCPPTLSSIFLYIAISSSPHLLHLQPCFHFLLWASSLPPYHPFFPLSPLSHNGSAIHPSIMSWGFELLCVMPGGFLWQAFLFALIRALQVA